MTAINARYSHVKISRKRPCLPSIRAWVVSEIIVIISRCSVSETGVCRGGSMHACAAWLQQPRRREMSSTRGTCWSKSPSPVSVSSRRIKVPKWTPSLPTATASCPIQMTCSPCLALITTIMPGFGTVNDRTEVGIDICVHRSVLCADVHMYTYVGHLYTTCNTGKTLELLFTGSV